MPIKSIHTRPWMPSLRSRSESPKRITSWNGTPLVQPPLKRLTSSDNTQAISNTQHQNYQIMRNLENEYIRSLQQQIYLLELENNYVRQQAANAVDMQPVMIQEASKTLTKVQELQAKIDALELELYRKEAHIGILEQKHNRLDQQLRENLLNHDTETDELKRQLVTLRGEREIALRDGLQKDAQLTELRNDLSRQKSSLAVAEVQIDMLRAKLENESARVRELETALVEKKTQMLQMNTTLKQLELQYRQDLTRMDHNANTEFQSKLERMQRQLSDCFLSAENNRFHRDKKAADVDLLTQENAKLNAELIKLQRQADETRSALERIEGRHNKELAELNALRQREKDLVYANATLRQDLTSEHKRTATLEKQLEKQERAYDHVVSNPSNQAQPIAAEQLVHLQEDKLNLMNHLNTMQRELTRQAAKLEELQQTQRNQYNQQQQQQQQEQQQQLLLLQQQQMQQKQQRQRVSTPSPEPVSRSPLPSPRYQSYSPRSPERYPSEVRRSPISQTSYPAQMRGASPALLRDQLVMPPVTKQGLRLG